MSDSVRDEVLVACIGNIFLGDDGFGCEVARELKKMNVGPSIKVIDYGIRGLDLAYSLLEPYRAVIFVDAIARSGQPGTVYILQCAEPSLDQPRRAVFDPHSMEPVNLLAMARSLGEVTSEIFIVGCEPTDFGDEQVGRMGLSHDVAVAVPEAARAVLELIARIRSSEKLGTTEICASK